MGGKLMLGDDGEIYGQIIESWWLMMKINPKPYYKCNYCDTTYEDSDSFKYFFDGFGLRQLLRHMLRCMFRNICCRNEKIVRDR